MATRVLLLEDSPIDAELVLSHLTRDEGDFSVRRAATRGEYLAAIAEEVFDIILADYSLPDYDGLAALRAARESAPHTPFLFVSGVVGEDFAINALKQGATDYVLKRNLTRLPTAVARALTESKAQQERRQALLALSEMRERLQAMFDNAQVGIIEIDLSSGRVLRANPAGHELLGFAPGAMEGVDLREFSLTGDDDTARFYERARRGAVKTFSFEQHYRRPDGKEIWASLSCNVICTGETAYCLTTVTDITARKHHERELRRVNEGLEVAVAERTDELEASNRQLVAEIAERRRAEATLRQMQRLEAVGQLTSGVAHDFNNLLTVVLGNLVFVRRTLGEDVDAEVRRRLSNIQDAAQRGAKLVGQLLAFSRRQRLDPAPVDLNATILEMRGLLQSTLGGSLNLETKLSDDLWFALVDVTQIELVILNLALNARDASPVGGALIVRTQNAMLEGAEAAAAQVTPGDYVALSVEDQGTGMAPEVREKAFEPFFTTKEVGKGSGLGLAQVYGFAKQSGGGAAIESVQGEGTKVRIYLPRATAAPAAKALRDGAADHGAHLHGRRILVVDDDPGVRDVTASFLRELGCEVLEASSGAGALATLNGATDVDFAVIDFAMPGMNGRELADELKQRRPNLPLLFITGYADLTELGDVQDDLILMKPFTNDDLRRRLHQMAAGRA